MINSHKARLAAMAMAVFGAAAVLGASLPAQAQTAPIVIGLGKSKLVELPSPYSDVMIADPKVADILPLNNHSVYIIG